MMISTHGYVAAEPEFGKPDTGGQVVDVLVDPGQRLNKAERRSLRDVPWAEQISAEPNARRQLIASTNTARPVWN